MFHAGQQIGLYKLIHKLGKGSFGEVWLAERQSPILIKKVAIKLPNDEQVDFDAIKREAMLWEKVSGHPNVLLIIDADIYDRQVVIVSEYADGGSLGDWLKKHRGKSPSLKEAVDLMIGILSGLAHLHSHKITHRDLKPNNILLHGDAPRIADFGISRIVENSSYGTEALGTPIYMSPEAFKKSTSPKTDIWSAGVIFYEMLSGYYPFYGNDVFDLMDSIRFNEPKPLPRDVPGELQKIVEQALQKKPDKRFQTAREMREAFLSFKQEAGQKYFAEKHAPILLGTQNLEMQTTEIESLNVTTLPIEDSRKNELFNGEKSNFDESLETQVRLPNRKTSVSTIAAASLIFLLGLGGIIWWLQPSPNKSEGNSPARITNTSKINPPVQPSSTPIISANTEAKSVDEKVNKPSSTSEVKPQNYPLDGRTKPTSSKDRANSPNTENKSQKNMSDSKGGARKSKPDPSKQIRDILDN